MLRIGWIDYANCSPLLMQLEGQLPIDTTEIVHGVPAKLNARLAEGTIDVCISSSIEFARHADEYLILPGHCIGSRGPVQSVLLFSRCPVETLAGERLLVTSESATSVALLQVLLSKRWNLSDYSLQATSDPWQDALQQAPALLLIGDRALQAASVNSDYHIYDLGLEWFLLTGLPFVYALWQINRKTVQGKEAALRHFIRLLDQARDRIAPDAHLLAAQAAEAQWLGTERLADYWRNAITYQFDKDHLRGLEQFYRFAAELSLIPADRKLHFYPL